MADQDQRFTTAEDSLEHMTPEPVMEESLEHMTPEPVMLDVAFVTSSQQPTIVSRGGGGSSGGGGSGGGSSGGGMLELLGMVARVMTSGLQVPNNHYYGPQQDPRDNNATRINIGTISRPAEVVDEPLDTPITVSPVHLTTALWILSLLTLIFVIGTALYKPAMGVFFGPNKVAYYPTLAAIFTSGVIEAFIAFWLSRSRNTNSLHFSFGRAALCFSIGPFVAIVGISGFSFLET